MCTVLTVDKIVFFYAVFERQVLIVIRGQMTSNSDVSTKGIAHLFPDSGNPLEVRSFDLWQNLCQATRTYLYISLLLLE